jgi:hypothetical protein
MRDSLLSGDQRVAGVHGVLKDIARCKPDSLVRGADGGGEIVEACR